AISSDAATIMQFVIDLAVYEKEPDAVVATEQHVRETLFCEQPQAQSLIAEIEGEPVGFAVYFFNYSTWLGKHGIYLEDLFVTPQSRGSGAGKALLRELAKIAVAKEFGRVEWSVLDWNEPAIKFYEAMGAEAKHGWTVFRLSDQALVDFAKS
ncbi:MAG: GNAT superfamily N-acetyltransferase, partial [Cryomorphaceae bacterium]